MLSGRSATPNAIGIPFGFLDPAFTCLPDFRLSVSRFYGVRRTLALTLRAAPQDGPGSSEDLPAVPRRVAVHVLESRIASAVDVGPKLEPIASHVRQWNHLDYAAAGNRGSILEGVDSRFESGGEGGTFSMG